MMQKDCVLLDNGIFQARIVPAVGGNVIGLRHLPDGTELLREPSDMEELARFPEQFGLPVLFPPNRIEDGRFTFEGKVCHLPVNEKAMNNHLHGLVVGRTWELVSHSADRVQLCIRFSPKDPEYENFPFAFQLVRELSLTENGLLDRMTVINQGRTNMPLGLGYHSTFPAKSVLVRVGTTSSRFEIGDRFLPTGRQLPWDKWDPRQWFDPAGKDIGFHAKAEKLSREDNSTFHGAQIRYESGLLEYITDEKFAFWYTWNKRGQGDFISLEPVSWIANALNHPPTGEDPFIRILAPCSEIKFSCALHFYPRKKFQK